MILLVGYNHCLFSEPILEEANDLLVTTYVGVAVFMGLIAYDTQKN